MMLFKLALILTVMTASVASGRKVNKRLLEQVNPADVAISHHTADVSQGPDAVSKVTAFPGFKVIFRSGDTTPDSTLPVATLVDKNMNPLMAKEQVANEWGYDISFNPDFFSIHHTAGGNLYAITQFESPNPSALYVTKLNQSADGTLTPVWHKPADLSSSCKAYGALVPAPLPLGALMRAARNTNLMATSLDGPETTSFQYCSDYITSTVRHMRFWGYEVDNVTMEDIKKEFNPYMYGHAFEASITDEEGSVEVTKHFVMGRHSYELWIVMPDNRTVYSSDDGPNTAFWKFVMDTPGDMSAGTLYGAKFYQQSDVDGGTFTVSWIPLGHGTQSEIMTLANTTKFSQIFDYEPFVNSTCPAGYRSISKRYNGLGASCLSEAQGWHGPPCNLNLVLLLPGMPWRPHSHAFHQAGMDQAAAFLESRRYLAYLGGTVELSKFEGLAYDAFTGKMYGAMSVIRDGMEDQMAKGTASTAKDEGGSNDIRLPYNKCGCVYAFDVTANYDVTSMYGELCGTPTAPSKRNAGNCDVSGIAEPDNIVVIPQQGTLIIAEDTNENPIDYMWSYDLTTKALTRIFSSPYGAETTSPYWVPDVNNFTYVVGAIQHPYGESDGDKLMDNGSNGPNGYVGGWAFLASDFAHGEKIQFIAIPPSTTEEMRHNVNAAASGFKLETSGPIYKSVSQMSDEEL